MCEKETDTEDIDTQIEDTDTGADTDTQDTGDTNDTSDTDTDTDTDTDDTGEEDTGIETPDSGRRVLSFQNVPADRIWRSNALSGVVLTIDGPEAVWYNGSLNWSN